MGAEGTGGTGYFPLNFALNLKLLLKSVFKKNHQRNSNWRQKDLVSGYLAAIKLGLSEAVCG